MFQKNEARGAQGFANVDWAGSVMDNRSASGF